MAKECIVDVATNGYHHLYPDCMRSHDKYVRRNGYDLLRLTRSSPIVEFDDAAWLKLHLIRRALADGYEWVGLVDTDALIRPRTPSLATVERNDCDVYVARGHSGRWNSGVLIFKNTPSSCAVLDEILQSRYEPVPEADQAPGENGHVINHLNRYKGVGELGREWNNTFEREPSSYIWHFTGPLKRRGFQMRVMRRLVRQFRSSKSLSDRVADPSVRMGWLVAQAKYVPAS